MNDYAFSVYRVAPNIGRSCSIPVKAGVGLDLNLPEEKCASETFCLTSFLQ